MSLQRKNILSLIVYSISSAITLLPFSYTCCHGETEEGELIWRYDFVFQDLVFLAMMVLFFLSFLLYKKQERGTNARILLLIPLSILALLFSLYGAALLFTPFPVQDFMPAIGTIPMMLLFPGLLFYFFGARKNN